VDSRKNSGEGGGALHQSLPRRKDASSSVVVASSIKNSGISVVMPVRGRAIELPHALRSVSEQESFKEFEIIVVDDGSEPPINPGITEFDSRISLVRHHKNRGAAAARNTGVNYAQGAYIAFSDSDDAWLPRKLNVQLKAMLDTDMQASTTHFFNARNGSVRLRPPSPSQVDLKRLLMGCFLCPGSTLMVEHNFFVEVGGFDETLKRLEDWDWLLRVARHGKILNLHEPLSCVSLQRRPNAEAVLEAVSQIRAKKSLMQLNPRLRRRFHSALDYEEAVAHLSAAKFELGAYKLIGSLVSTPFARADIVSRRLKEMRVPAHHIADGKPHLSEFLKVVAGVDEVYNPA